MDYIVNASVHRHILVGANITDYPCKGHLSLNTRSALSFTSLTGMINRVLRGEYVEGRLPADVEFSGFEEKSNHRSYSETYMCFDPTSTSWTFDL